jgi:archaeal flagellar protein FlaJ
MKFKIPFTLSDIETLKRRSKFFSSYIKPRRKLKLNDDLSNIGLNLTREEYLGITYRTLVYSFIILFIISSTVLFFLQIKLFYLFALGIAFLFSIFIFFSQMIYPHIYISRKQREIEKNLLSALEDILIQINSGIPLFNIMVNISGGDYGVLSQEFKKAVKMINTGVPESVALQEIGKMNPSVFFRRTLWQISNGMNAGSDMGIVIKDSIKALNEEQLIQIQSYGNKLNPLIVMYMLMAVIIPALSVTFLTIISSMVSLPKNMSILMFVALFVFDILFQVMFLGLIRSRRPSLM